MAKIYRNFEDLVEQNKGLFSVILKNGNVNLLEAIWNARQAEIDNLKAQNLSLMSANHKLNETNNSYKIELEVLNKQRDVLCVEMTTMKNMIDSNKKVVSELKLQIAKANEKYQVLENENKGRLLEHDSALSQRDLTVARFKKLESDYKLLSFQFEEFKQNTQLHMQENSSIFENVMIDRDNYKSFCQELESELNSLKTAFSNLQVNYERSKQLLNESRQVISSRDNEINRLKISNDNKSEEIAHFVSCFTEFQKKLTTSKIRKSVSEVNH